MRLMQLYRNLVQIKLRRLHVELGLPSALKKVAYIILKFLVIRKT